MDTEQARAILRANEVKQRALLNLENAARMSTDDPRSKELLEEAGDAYAEATAKLRGADQGAVDSLPTPVPTGSLSSAAAISKAPQGQPPKQLAPAGLRPDQTAKLPP